MEILITDVTEMHDRNIASQVWDAAAKRIVSPSRCEVAALDQDEAVVMAKDRVDSVIAL